MAKQSYIKLIRHRVHTLNVYHAALGTKYYQSETPLKVTIENHKPGSFRLFHVYHNNAQTLVTGRGVEVYTALDVYCSGLQAVFDTLHRQDPVKYPAIDWEAERANQGPLNA